MNAVCSPGSQGNFLISITHKISAQAETKVIKELVVEFRKVEGKTTLLFKMALAAEAEPSGRVCDVIFPVVSQKTISDLANGYRSENPSFSYPVHRKIRRSYAQHYRCILPVIPKTFTFRSHNGGWCPLLDAIEVLAADTARNGAVLAGAVRCTKRKCCYRSNGGNEPILLKKSLISVRLFEISV